MDGNGNFTSSSTTLTVSGQNGTIATNSGSGTYLITPNGDLTKTDSTGSIFNGGTLLTNGNAFVLSQLTARSQPIASTGVKLPQNATLASVQGNYTFVMLSNFGSRDSLDALSAANGTLTGTFTENDAARITTGAFPPTPYTVAANGAVTVGAGADLLSGAVSADGDLIVLTNIQGPNNTAAPTLAYGVKQGTGVTTATVSGHYTEVVYFPGFDELISQDFDGNGNWTSASTQNQGGVVSADANSGTYTVAADGTLVLQLNGGTVHGAVSGDGHVLVLTDIDQSGLENTLQAVFLGVRQ